MHSARVMVPMSVPSLSSHETHGLSRRHSPHLHHPYDTATPVHPLFVQLRSIGLASLLTVPR